ncbi:T9SS type B sorting domain-containing protein [Flavobacterium sp. H122]|uniref:T9SS type B sorting domain-containing protein n=1 Tax=Flavobacterium sp. H122 TaxID=2529860 RepID=UPI0010AA2F79|nr:T9SS type B sorting domain-containing protein [Flavobacterium sp. H122]
MFLKKIIFFLFFTTLAYSQKEASVWYFGSNAGIKFNADNSITTLTDSQMIASEACATLADSNGNLLFYTDGVKVWNKNHQIMSNGNDLAGHWSTTQTAIVPKPGSPNLFYIFTLDYEVHPNGFRYSVVDMNLNGSLGDVTNEKNILIYAPSNEKIAIVKHANNVDYWVVTHGFGNNTFYSHLLSSSGLSNSPTLSNTGTVVSGSTDNVWGYMKISPDGSKLAVCSLLNTELFDFDSSSGQVTNPKILYFGTDNEMSYGTEFSPDNNILYISIAGLFKIIQYDLNAPNIASSAFDITTPNIQPCALQLGPDNKIYIAQFFKRKLGVINNPNTLGIGCTVQTNMLDLNDKRCEMGLPFFTSSLFYTPVIQWDTSCENDNTTFTISGIQNITAVTWDFGDGSPVQNAINGNHTYLTPNTYTVTATVSTPTGIRTNTREITIFPKPVITYSVFLKQCDDNIDGFSVFNLTEANSKISANYQNETFTYYKLATDAQSGNNPIPNPTTYTNQTVSNDVVYVKIVNTNGCFRIAQLNLNVSTTQIPATFTRSFTVCDDSLSGSNTDRVASFNFSSVTAQIQNIFPVGQQLNITYYRNLADALAEQNAIADTANYSNIGYPNTQNIYIRVDSKINNDCLGLGQHITLNVERIPIVQPKVYQHCDDDQDGNYAFNTGTVQSELLNGVTNVSVSYFDQNNNPLPSPLPNPFVTPSQTLRVVVRNNTATGCQYETTIKFIVDDLPEAFPISTSLTTICDDEANPVNQDGKYAFDTSTFHNTILGNQTGLTINYYDQNNNPLPSPLPNPFMTGTQNIRVEVINPTNTNCMASISIPFVVHPVPKINLSGNEIVCNAQTITKTLDAGLLDNSPTTDYTYVWKKDGTLLTNETNYSLNITLEGLYTVEVTNAYGCSRTRTMNVSASDLATITDVQVSDLSNNNSIVVTVIGNGDYVYSLDNTDFQQSNVFSNIPAGVYTVYVKDLNGCGVSSKEVSVLGIPAFFTPNGDGYHDYWNIQGISMAINTNTKILIFDRFGKLLKELSPLSQGWDGTYLGNPLPANDYWYTIQLEDGRNLKGHFSLKR